MGAENSDTRPQRPAARTGNTKWVEVASLRRIPEGPTLDLGLTEEGRWVAVAADGSVFDVAAAQNYMPFFPLLDLSYEGAREMLVSEFSNRGLDPQWLALFPFERVVASAFTSGSKFWPDLALRWMDKIKMSNVLEDSLNFLHQHRKTQQQRHAERRLLAQYRRSQVKASESNR
jgi:hypothetical protein